MKKQACAGKIYLRNGEEHRGTVKIMAIADGWVMARHKGCAPFLKTEKEFFAQYTEVYDNYQRNGTVDYPEEIKEIFRDNAPISGEIEKKMLDLIKNCSSEQVSQLKEWAALGIWRNARKDDPLSKHVTDRLSKLHSLIERCENADR